jgi:hypothetical protein
MRTLINLIIRRVMHDIYLPQTTISTDYNANIDLKVIPTSLKPLMG